MTTIVYIIYTYIMYCHAMLIIIVLLPLCHYQNCYQMNYYTGQYRYKVKNDTIYEYYTEYTWLQNDDYDIDYGG